MPRGGARPNAGAPKGNTNALKHGRYSARVQQALQRLSDDPDLKTVIAVLEGRARNGRSRYAHAIDLISRYPPDIAAAIIAGRFPPEVARQFNLVPTEVVDRLRDYEAGRKATRRLRAMLQRHAEKKLYPPYRSLLDDPWA